MNLDLAPALSGLLLPELYDPLDHKIDGLHRFRPFSDKKCCVKIILRLGLFFLFILPEQKFNYL